MTPAPWLAEVVQGLPTPGPGATAILLDPSGALSGDELDQWDHLVAATRWQARQQYELHLRDRPADAPPVLLHVTTSEVTRLEHLPWDLSQLAVARLDPRLSPDLISALAETPAVLVEAVCAEARTGGHPGRLLASSLLGVTLPAPDEAAELLAACRARSAAVPERIRALIAAEFTSPLAREAAVPPGPSGGDLARAWNDWCERGADSPYSVLFARCGPGLLALVEAGDLIVPVDLPGALPPWVPRTNCRDVSAQLHRFLEAAPQTPVDLTGWIEVATWWGRLRWTAASAPSSPDVLEDAWRLWAEYDVAFLAWMQANYAQELGRSYLPPRTVDKIAPFLAHSRRRRGRPQILVVLDGMGLPQWQQLAAVAGFTEAERHVVLAALPTITQVSRQAILSGKLPTDFVATISSPAEERLWRAFWASQHVPDNQIHYLPCNGRDLPALRPDAQAVGIVINTIDEAMHATGGFEDPGFRDLVTRFADGGLLPRLREQAARVKADLWFTADHGNLPCRGLPERVPQQGLRVRSRGKRVWTYATAQLRDAANVPGVAWDPPGYPQKAGYPLFAPGRTCYERDAVLISHGGLSLDEVLVPLVRVQT